MELLYEINVPPNVLEIHRYSSFYYITVKGQVGAAQIRLTKDEFNHIAQEIYKLWQPTNIVEALDKLK